MKVEQYKLKERQAKFWHAFAYLAVHGKRDKEAFWIAMYTDPPNEEQVKAIMLEAETYSKSKLKP